MSNYRFIIIDCNSVIHRAYHALPRLTTKDGRVVSAVYGFLLVFLRAVKEFQPDFIAAAFDVPGPTFRHKEYKKYKAKRPPTPEEIRQQIPEVKKILNVFSVPIFEKEGFEADDIIGTISYLAPKKQVIPKIETIILSGDRDILQLVNSQTKVYLLKRGVKNVVLYDIDLVKEKYEGLTPSQLLDFKGLRGDPSDNIPGVTGIGEKTAIQLIKKFGSLERLYENIKNKEKTSKIQISDKLKKRLIDYKEQAFFSRDLARIKKNVLIDFNLKDCRWNNYNREEVVNVLKNLEFYSLIKRLPNLSQKENKENLRLW